jgi:hypothetical protein
MTYGAKGKERFTSAVPKEHMFGFEPNSPEVTLLYGTRFNGKLKMENGKLRLANILRRLIANFYRMRKRCITTLD